MKINQITFDGAYKITLNPANSRKTINEIDSFVLPIRDRNTTSIITRGDNNTFCRNLFINDKFDNEFEFFLKNRGIKFQKINISPSPSEEEIRKRLRVPPYAIERYRPELVEINTKEFDKVFQKDTFSQYLGSVETMSQRHRYMNFIEYLKTNKPINASEVYIQEINGEPEICFQDGRHRYAVLRDLGFKTIPVAMNDESYAIGCKHGLIK